MSRKVKKKKVSRTQRPPSEPRFAGLGPLLPVGAVVGVLVLTLCGLEWLRGQVLSDPEHNPQIKIELDYLPGSEWVEQEGWLPRIQASIRLPLDETRSTPDEPVHMSFMDPNLLSAVARNVMATGWVRSVEQVVRGMDGTIRVCCDYRRPIAMVLTNSGTYIPVDKEGVRLPEEYNRMDADSGWMRILGVQTEPPGIGASYSERRRESDAVAAVQLAYLLFSQSEIADKVTAIDVTNYGGRESRFKDHIVLYTRNGGQFMWGSAIGREIEEPNLADKLRNLALYLRSNPPPARADLTIERNGVVVHLAP